jgi:hypothetical protein
VGPVDIYKGVIGYDLALGHGDKPHTDHVCGQLVDLVKCAVAEGQRLADALGVAQA